MKRLTDEHWRNLDPWECCGQDKYCNRGCHDEGGCVNGCIVPKLYARLAAYENTGLEPEEMLGHLPSAEKTGKWINHKDEHRCSCCGEVVTGDWFYEGDAYSYCPNCGADMRAEE